MSPKIFNLYKYTVTIGILLLAGCTAIDLRGTGPAPPLPVSLGDNATSNDTGDNMAPGALSPAISPEEPSSEIATASPALTSPEGSYPGLLGPVPGTPYLPYLVETEVAVKADGEYPRPKVAGEYSQREIDSATGEEIKKAYICRGGTLYFSWNGVEYPTGPTEGMSCPEGVERTWSIAEGTKVDKDKEAAQSYDVPVVINDRVNYYLDHYKGEGRRYFAKWLERSGRYIPLIKERFREEGIPEDLAYLALIESGFNTHARSKASAVGIWQFISWTGMDNGLAIDWWVDERRDPVMATDAAAKHLRYLYEKFDDWYLAAAAYNAGAGRIRGVTRRFNSRDFWEIAEKRRRGLRRETRDYVPKYIAAMLIAKNPEMYGFTDLKYDAPMAYDTVTLKSATDIKIIASAAMTTQKEIKRLNPSLLRYFTPPRDEGYTVRIPKGARGVFDQNMASLPERSKVSFRTHKVEAGESLYTIARRYSTPIQPIIYLNKIKKASLIREGASIMIPLRARGVQVASFGGKSGDDTGAYTIKSGDTLWGISSKFGVRLKDILEINGMTERDTIRPGQKIYLEEARLTGSVITDG